jgi:hypothetical protein
MSVDDSSAPIDGVTVHRIETILTGAEVERFVVVAGDLGFLASLPNDRLLTHTEVRISASIMRRLFVDGQLMAVWRTLTNQTRIKPTVVDRPRLSTIEVAQRLALECLGRRRRHGRRTTRRPDYERNTTRDNGELFFTRRVLRK